jgi:hypothetical protein
MQKTGNDVLGFVVVAVVRFHLRHTDVGNRELTYGSSTEILASSPVTSYAFDTRGDCLLRVRKGEGDTKPIRRLHIAIVFETVTM